MTLFALTFDFKGNPNEQHSAFKSKRNKGVAVVSGAARAVCLHPTERRINKDNT